MTYKIKYSLKSKELTVKEGTIKVKNANDSIHAQIKLESYFKGKYKFDQMIVHKCDPSNNFNDLFDSFRNKTYYDPR
jgi:hypothetical protein